MKKAQLLEHDKDVQDVYAVDVDDFEPSEEQILFDRFKDESQDDLIGIIKVYRIPNSDQITNLYTAKTLYLFNVPVDQFGYEGLLDFIREKYGSGAYRLIGTMPNQKGTRFNKIVEIEAPKEADKPVTVSDSPPRSESMSAMLSAFASIMKESQERTADLVRGLVQNQVPKDPMEQMGVMMGVMAQMKTFFGGGQSESTGLVAELEKHKVIADIIGGGAETNESDVWVKLAETFAPAILKGIGQGAPVPDTPLLSSSVPGAEQVTLQPGAGVTEPGLKKESPEMLNLKTQAAALYGAAKNGIAPEKMANTILNLTPDDKIEDLYAFMNSESCVQTFVDAHPPLESYRNWLAKVQVTILGELVQDDFPGVDTSQDELIDKDKVHDEGDVYTRIRQPFELLGKDEGSDTGVWDSEKELTETDDKPKIPESEKTKPKAKAKAGKKRAVKPKEPNH